MTWLEFINKFFFQWFFIRLAQYRQVEDYELNHVAHMADGSTHISGRGNFKWRYKFIGFIVPTTGWSEKNDFKFIIKKFGVR